MKRPQISLAIAAALSATLWVLPGSAVAGPIDSDIARLPPALPGTRYDPAALEAYQQQMDAYRQALGAEQAAQQARTRLRRQQQEAYQRALAASQAASRRYRADMQAYETLRASRRACSSP